MAFKTSGVRLPLAPPLSELHFNGLCANKFRGSFKEKVIKSYKRFAPELRMCCGSQIFETSGQSTSTARDVRALDVACTTTLSRPRRFSRHSVLRHNAQCNFGGLDHRRDGGHLPSKHMLD